MLWSASCRDTGGCYYAAGHNGDYPWAYDSTYTRGRLAHVRTGSRKMSDFCPLSRSQLVHHGAGRGSEGRGIVGWTAGRLSAWNIHPRLVGKCSVHVPVCWMRNNGGYSSSRCSCLKLFLPGSEPKWVMLECNSFTVIYYPNPSQRYFTVVTYIFCKLYLVDWIVGRWLWLTCPGYYPKPFN